MNLFTGLFLLFCGFKLAGQLDWSWWWVTSPIWGAILLGILLLIWKESEK